ncbi:DNA polymerase I [Facklamia miroungae]|uniref:DNA polymerase I n=1 Tax=Facklamia miroungae TaxID=120956 RepID=A0A1G7TKY4_9LACT|nr:DNA polymerase I [Facklamia miroungae]NKZ29792.1 DNA polymerase I [Facklamia miroungae]SDG35996.1 DNA polymerase I [Facklamia miroungae]
MSKRTLLLIDGSSLAYRAFFSILDIERFKNRAGLHTNALYSFKRMLDNVLNQFKPTHVLVAFDKSDVTFRTGKFQDYKGGRQKTPSEFKEQMPYFRVLLEAYGIKHYALGNYEADDIIGTLAHQADDADEVIVLSGDKDLTQLASDKTTVYITRKGVSDIEAYTPESIQEKWGITPLQIIDMKGLMGDSSDNYPGITRIGEKTALKLLHQFGSVEAMYERLDELKASKMKENIINDEKNARMSKDLARILHDAPIEITIEDMILQKQDTNALVEFYRQMDFHSFLKDLQADQSDSDAIHQAAKDLPNISIEVIESAEAINQTILPEQAVYYSETLQDNYHFAPVEAVAWLDYEKNIMYILQKDQAFSSQVFKDWLADPSKQKIFYDYKREAVIASRYGATIRGIEMDVLIATYLIDTHNNQELVDIANLLQLPVTVQYDEAVYGKGAKRKIPEDGTVFYQHLANKLQTLKEVKSPLEKRLDGLEMTELYQEIEMPLAQTLAEIEIRGIKVDRSTLDDKNEQVQIRMQKIEEEIHEMAGREFNLNSPKQLGIVLFEDLGLPVIKKTKTGYSTAADVLEKLTDKHPIIPAILGYRQIAKLQSTYLAGLPPYIKEDGKIHTRFVQTLTQTGRLSSTDPNLQNIPIRIEEGRMVRQAFVPSKKGWKLFGADYSQIELRVLAHISQDQHMQEAFINNEDIHSATARRVFNLEDDQAVDADHRRQAKAVNFGIVYGISDYGLSQNLNITRKKAKAFIDRYFEMFPGIKTFMESIVEEAKEKGYVKTLFNRRRYLPDIHASNFNVRSFAERTAMNSPIQGTAADIIKVAMVQLDHRLKEEGCQSRMILQIHDELILEGPEEEVVLLEKIVPQVMEEAADLSVPLKVDYHYGDSWLELK